MESTDANADGKDKIVKNLCGWWIGGRFANNERKEGVAEFNTNMEAAKAWIEDATVSDLYEETKTQMAKGNVLLCRKKV